VNTKEYHWLVHKTITRPPRYYTYILSHYRVNYTIQTVPLYTLMVTRRHTRMDVPLIFVPCELVLSSAAV